MAAILWRRPSRVNSHWPALGHAGKLKSMSSPLRAGLTALWLVVLTVFFRWWELALKVPGLLLWSALFVGLFCATAAAMGGTALLRDRARVLRPARTWLGIVALAFIATRIVPEVHIAGQLVRTVLFLPTFDWIIPLWIVARAMTLIWSGWRLGVVLAGIPVALLLLMWWFVVRMPGSSFAGALPPLTLADQATQHALEIHIRTLATEIGPRNLEHAAALERSVVYLRDALHNAGYVVAEQEFAAAGQTFRNLEVEIRGSSRPDEIVVVGGHYDSAGDAPGADDNASGAAAVLELARRFKSAKPARTVRFVLFTNEEPPFFDTEFMGSRVYAARSAARHDNIVAMISLETLGYYKTEPGSQRYPLPFSLFYPSRGDFIGFVANLGSGDLVRQGLAAFRAHASFPSQGAAAPAFVPGIGWSDHASFWHEGYPAIMITDTAPFRNANYHQPGDRPVTLDFERMARVVSGVAEVIAALAA